MVKVLELERKFRVGFVPVSISHYFSGTARWIEQGYLCFDPPTRVRLELPFPQFRPSWPAGEEQIPSRDRRGWKAYLGSKVRNKSGDWKTQQEEEVGIPPSLGWTLFDNVARATLSKVRYRVSDGDFILDVFTKPCLSGLIIVERELAHPLESIAAIGAYSFPGLTEVTEDPRYRNVNLAQIASLEELED